jgi:hypothetical protein
MWECLDVVGYVAVLMGEWFLVFEGHPAFVVKFQFRHPDVLL